MTTTNNPNNPPPPPQIPADIYDVAKQLEDSIKNSKRLQQNTYQELGKTINLLSRINDLRDSSVSKVKALNRESINTREIEREVRKFKEKDELSQIRIDRLQSNMVANSKTAAEQYLLQVELRTKKEKELERAREIRDVNAIASLSSLVSGLDSQIELAEKNLSIEQRQYAAALQSKKVSEQAISDLQTELDLEKEIKKEVGFTGLALGKLSETLGFGTKAYEKMVEKARDLKEEDRSLSFGQKFKAVTSTIGDAVSQTFKDPVLLAGAAVGAYKLLESGLTSVGNAASKAGNFLAGLSQDSSNIVRGLTSGLSDIARKIPLIGGLVGGLIDGFSAVLDLVIGVDNFIVKSGRDLNLDAASARELNRQFQNISFNSGNVLITSRKLLESQVELSNQLGVVNILTKEQLQTNIALKDIAGLDLETRQKILETSIITGKSEESVVKSVLAQVQGLKNATGIQFQNKQILKETSSLTGYLGLQFAKFPASLTKSLVTIKAMGLEMKQLDSIADSFLDFESSISKEFEAQLLTGKDINLAKAREAFLNNDLATAAAEITSQVGSAADFLKLNRIQAESLAGAFGMSRDQMGEMLRQQQLLSRLGAKDTDNAQKQLELGLKKFQTQEALVEAIGEEAYQTLVTGSNQEKIAGFIEKIKQTIVDFVESSGIIEKIQNFINYISDPSNVKKILITVRDTFADIAEVVLSITSGMISLIDTVTFGFGIDEKFQKSFEETRKNIPTKIREFGGNFETVSVSQNKANTEAKATQQVKQTQDNMSMAKPVIQNTIIYEDHSYFDTNSGKWVRNAIPKTPNTDIQTGQMGQPS